MPPPTPRRCLGGHRRHRHPVSVVDRQVVWRFSTLISSLQRLEFLGRLPVSDVIRAPSLSSRSGPGRSRLTPKELLCKQPTSSR